MEANVTCLSCILSKREKMARDKKDDEKKAAYFHDLLGILYEYGQKESAPWLAAKIDELYEAYYGVKTDYKELKHKYNQLMLSKEKELETRIRSSADPVYTCIQYVCAGNYIDFSAVSDINETMLQKLLDKAEEKAADETASEEEYQHFRKDLEYAKKLVYLTDNCGEIVLDKLFIRILKEQYPELDITVIVRGQDVLNDATMEDAREVGLSDIVECIGNGCATPGTVLTKVSEEAKQKILSADVIISKGQGNFEGMYGSGVNPYYMFLCKCELFVRRFGLPQFTSVFAREDHIKTLI